MFYSCIHVKSLCLSVFQRGPSCCKRRRKKGCSCVYSVVLLYVVLVVLGSCFKFQQYKIRKTSSGQFRRQNPAWAVLNSTKTCLNRFFASETSDRDFFVQTPNLTFYIYAVFSRLDERNIMIESIMCF